MTEPQEYEILLRVQATLSNEHAGLQFRLLDYTLEHSEVFSPMCGLPILVAKSLARLDLVHPSGPARDVYPFEIIPASDDESLLGFAVRLARRKGRGKDRSAASEFLHLNIGMGIMHLDFEIEEALKLSMTPGMLDLTALLPALDRLSLKLPRQTPAPTAAPEQIASVAS